MEARHLVSSTLALCHQPQEAAALLLAHRHQATLGLNPPPRTPFKETSEVRNLLHTSPEMTTNYPTVFWHVFFSNEMSLCLIVFPWRWSNVTFFFLLKSGLVAWLCSPGRDLDGVHVEKEGERMEGKKRIMGRESAGLREIVWVHYCNHAEIKQHSSILWGLQGNCFCVQRDWDHILLDQRKERESVWYSLMYRGGENELLAWVRNGKIKKAVIRKSPRGKMPDSEQWAVHSRWNLCWDVILQPDYVRRKGRIWKRLEVIIPRTMQTYWHMLPDTKQGRKKDTHSAASTGKMHEISKIKTL